MISFEVGGIPKSTPYLFADLAELLVCFGGYSELSKSDLEDVIKRGEEDPDPQERDEGPGGLESSAEKQNKLLEYIDDCFVHLEYRVAAFDSCYPFKVESGVLSRRGSLTDYHCLYICLLVCSRLRSFPSHKQQELASLFERVSKDVMKAVMPDSAVVRLFGPNSDDRRNYYGTNLRDALLKLGEDLHETTMDENIQQESSSGDKGLDVVGYVHLGDSARGSLAFLGQCAAREREWPKKTFEAHPDHWRAFFNFAHNPANIVFIPVCYRQANGEWVKNSSSYGAVLLDRLRICKLLEGKTLPAEVSNLFAQGDMAIA